MLIALQHQRRKPGYGRVSGCADIAATLLTSQSPRKPGHGDSGYGRISGRADIAATLLTSPSLRALGGDSSDAAWESRPLDSPNGQERPGLRFAVVRGSEGHSHSLSSEAVSAVSLARGLPPLGA